MRLTRKFTVALVAGVLVVQVGFGALRVQRERDLFQVDIARDEEVLGRSLALASERVARTSGVSAARQLVNEANRGDAHVQIRWIELAEGAAPEWQPQVQRATLEPLLVGKQVWAAPSDDLAAAYSYTPVRLPAGGLAAIEVTDSFKDERAYLRKSVRNAVLSTAALVALCGLVGWVIGHFFIGRPVRALVGRARAIGLGQLEGTVELDQRDELGELADEMNAMAGALQRSRERIDKEAQARIAVLEQLKHVDRLRTVGTLASGIAHELGTPLNVVEGHAQLILEDGGAGGEAHDNAKVIKRQSRRMTAIIRQLLDFARREHVVEGSADVVAAARQTTEMVAPFAKKRGVSVILTTDDSLPQATIGVDELVQVLSNLVINAIQAMPDGGEVTVALTAVAAAAPWTNEAERAMIRLVVSDRGRGMDADTVERVFEPFFTTKAVGQGTGLGLSVAYGIVAERKGWISVDSTPDQGSAFSVFLPAADKAA